MFRHKNKLSWLEKFTRSSWAAGTVYVHACSTSQTGGYWFSFVCKTKGWAKSNYLVFPVAQIMHTNHWHSSAWAWQLLHLWSHFVALVPQTLLLTQMENFVWAIGHIVLMVFCHWIHVSVWASWGFPGMHFRAETKWGALNDHLEGPSSKMCLQLQTPEPQDTLPNIEP